MTVLRAIQFVRPHGQKRPIETAIDDPTGEIALLQEEMEVAGCHLEAEVLTTGEVHFTVSDDEQDLDRFISENGPPLVTALVEMIKRAAWRKKENSK